MLYKIEWRSRNDRWSTLLEHDLEMGEEEWRKFVHDLMIEAAEEWLSSDLSVGLHDILRTVGTILELKHGFKKPTTRVIGFGSGYVLTENDKDLRYIFGNELIEKLIQHNHALEDDRGKIEMVGEGAPPDQEVGNEKREKDSQRDEWPTD